MTHVISLTLQELTTSDTPGHPNQSDLERTSRGVEGCRSSCPHEAKSESRCKDWGSADLWSSGLIVQQTHGPRGSGFSKWCDSTDRHELRSEAHSVFKAHDAADFSPFMTSRVTAWNSNIQQVIMNWLMCHMTDGSSIQRRRMKVTEAAGECRNRSRFSRQQQMY